MSPVPGGGRRTEGTLAMSSTNPAMICSTPNRALLVDDDKMMLVAIGDLLRDGGIAEVITATSGNAGITAFDRMRPPPDLVVCDLNMPGGDGFQFMEQLGARAFTGGVVVVSGLESRILGSAALMAKFHNLHVLDVLSKPVDASELRSALSKRA